MLVKKPAKSWLNQIRSACSGVTRKILRRARSRLMLVEQACLSTIRLMHRWPAEGKAPGCCCWVHEVYSKGWSFPNWIPTFWLFQSGFGIRSQSVDDVPQFKTVLSEERMSRTTAKNAWVAAERKAWRTARLRALARRRRKVAARRSISRQLP